MWIKEGVAIALEEALSSRYVRLCGKGGQQMKLNCLDREVTVVEATSVNSFKNQDTSRHD